MTWVKKINSEWNPQEHPGIIVGDVVNFAGVTDRLLAEGNLVLCDEHGNEVSQYDATGVPSARELEDFKQWRQMQQQEALKKSLESERDTLLAEAESLKAAKAATEPTPVPVTPAISPVQTVEEAKTEIEQKKKEWGAKMAAARAAKKAAATTGTEAVSA